MAKTELTKALRKVDFTSYDAIILSPRHYREYTDNLMKHGQIDEPPELKIFYRGRPVMLNLSHPHTIFGSPAFVKRVDVP